MRLKKKRSDGLAITYMPLIMLVAGVGAITSIPFAAANATNEPANPVAGTDITVSEPAPQLGPAPSYDSLVVHYTNDTVKAIETYVEANPDSTIIPVNEIRTIIGPVRAGWVPGWSIRIHGTPSDFCVTANHSEGTQYKIGKTWDDGNRPYYLYSSELGGEPEPNVGISSLQCAVSGGPSVL